jgi:hypothetical protein
VCSSDLSVISILPPHPSFGGTFSSEYDLPHRAHLNCVVFFNIISLEALGMDRLCGLRTVMLQVGSLLARKAIFMRETPNSRIIIAVLKFPQEGAYPA